MCKSLLCCSGSPRHSEIPIFCHGGCSEVCVLHFDQSFTVLHDHLIFPMVALPIHGGSWFPSHNHTQFLALLSFFLSVPKPLHYSPQTRGWFRAALGEGSRGMFVLWACWAGPSEDKCQLWYKQVQRLGEELCYRELGWFAQLPRVGVTHCKDRRWKEQFTPGEMRFGQGGWPNGSTAKCCTPCFFSCLYLISRMHLQLAELFKSVDFFFFSWQLCLDLKFGVCCFYTSCQ